MHGGGTNLLRVREYNQQLVLELIRHGDEASRAGIAEKTGLTAQTVSNIVRRLLNEGLITELGRGVASEAGRERRVKLRINPEAGYSVGVQIDREETSFVLVDLKGWVLARRRGATSQAETPSVLVDRAADTVRRLIGEAGIPEEKVLGLGIACPGPLDLKSGVVYDPPGLSGWEEVRLKEMLEGRTSYPVMVENDAVAAAVGEHWLGEARGASNFAFVYMGGGMGMGLFVDGRVYRGSTGTAGEIAHIPLDPNGPECWCGSRGCLVRYCSPKDVVSAVERRLEREGRGALGVDSRKVDFKSVCRAAMAGDPLTYEVLEHAGKMLGNALVGLMNGLDMELVVLGGRTFEEMGQFYGREIERALRDRVLYRHRRVVRVRPSKFGKDASAVGAASLILYSAFAPRLAGLRAS